MTEADQQRGLHQSYLKLRAMIPGAFRTPHAPTPEQVWDTTEKSLSNLIEDYDRLKKRLAAITNSIENSYGQIREALYK